jgi:isoleucyl-tRNA synthetase
MPAGPDAELPYPDVPTSADYPALELEIIDLWKQDKTFEASVEQRPTGPDGSNEFVFYDGPPFANGLPHYGHLITGFVKDAVPRFQTMKGRRVERRFGWDCHGLPAEMEAERELGISGHVAINQFGIAAFNDVCRTSVLRYTQEWEDYVTRQARWVDFANDYKTLDLPYMESVMWAFKQLWDKGLIYEGYKVLPYCWECETPLSNFETKQDDAYRERQDRAVTVWFELETGERVLVWTTTPWTLPSNLALAVGPDIDYAIVEEDGQRYIVGEATLGKFERELSGAERVGTVKGADLVGRTYTPIFDFFADVPGAFRVLAGDFVSTDDGTGTVHIAPGFGEDDQRVSEANDIPVRVPVDEHGRFTAEVSTYEGQQVFDANANIIRDLKARGVVVRDETIVHSYPHCWRTRTPLIYKAVGSWFVKVSAIKDRMLELNQEITWVPEHIRDGRFGHGIADAPDWAISRNRFWGSPLPVWKSDNPDFPRIDVYGSLDELEADFGVRPGDLHRPAIDELTRPNPDDPSGQSTMRRVDEVLDCWFESGAMPFAQVHYPFENREWLEDHYPADFIVEYNNQTRGWFYTLHVLATALFDRPSFRNCIAHGVLLGDDGQKLSKSLRNYPDPTEVLDTIGADAMRWAMLSSPVLRGGDLVVERRAMEESVRQVLNPIWNAWHFFTLYANTDGYQAQIRTDAPGVLDRYVLAKTHELAAEVNRQMEAYDLFAACAAVRSYLDALNNWYIRRSRDRFWTSDRDAFDTLATVLHTVCRVVAPLLPMLSESIFRGLTGERSVHLTDWPADDELPSDPALVTAMDRVREVCSAASSIRKSLGLRNRLPLPSLTIAAAWAQELAPFTDLIADEVNVKHVDLASVRDLGDEVFEVDLKVVGPKLGKDTPRVLAAMRSGDWDYQADDKTLTAAGHTFAEGEYVHRLTPRDERAARALPSNDAIVSLDTDVTPELEAEGLARDVIRQANEARKSADLRISDRIRLVVDVGHHGDVAAALEAHREMVMRDTLATELITDEPLVDAFRAELPDGRALHIGVSPDRG